jgi:hypothetical protein
MEPKPYVLIVGTVNPPPYTKACFTLYADDQLFEVAEEHPALHCFDHREGWRAYTTNPRWNSIDIETELRELLDTRIIEDSGDFLWGVYPSENNQRR